MDAVAAADAAVDLLSRYQQRGDRAALDAAIRLFRGAVEDLSPDDPARSVILSNLSGALLLRFEAGGRGEDLDRAVAAGREALTVMPAEHAARPGCLTNMAAALLARFERRADPPDLDDAIEAARQAWGSGLSPDPGATASNLCITLLTRFEQAGRAADLDEAIIMGRDAVAVTAEEEPSLAGRLSNLAIALRARFELTGQLADLDQAISLGRAAVAHADAGHPGRAMYLSNLGGALWNRYERAADAADLTDAVRAGREAVKATPDSDPHRAAQRLSHPDLDEAVATADAAVHATAPADSQLPDHLCNQSTALRARYLHGANPADLDRAVDTARDAVGAAHAGHPGRAVYLVTLGNVLSLRHERTGRAADLDAALAAWQGAAATSVAAAAVRVHAARSWGSLARQQARMHIASDGYAAAIDLLPSLAWHGLDRATREFQLGSLPGLPSDAAEAAIAAGQPERAIELLEQGRSVLWTQALHLRRDLTLLAQRAPGIAERLDEIRRVLDRPGLASVTPHTRAETAGREPGAARANLELHRALATEWDERIREVRRIPGFERFMVAAPFGELSRAAAKGPVVIVNVAAAGCHAVLLRSAGTGSSTAGALQVIGLPGLTRTEASRRAQALLTALHDATDLSSPDVRDMLLDILDWLWDSTAVPVLAALGLGTPSYGAPLPRLWWCPTGPMTLLPLHAAARRPRGSGSAAAGEAVPARVVSSYVTTLGALLRAREAAPARDIRQLVVAMPDTPGAARLPTAAREASIVARYTSAIGRVRTLEGEQATRAEVLDALPGHPWLHLACHAVQDPGEPSASGFLLSGGRMTVADLADLHLPGPELGVLSGCATAAPAASLLDEAIHPAAAMQLAGYRHVIATLWSMYDFAGPRLAAALYGQLTAGGRPNADAAPYALHQAAESLRRRHPTHPGVWAPFAHFGP